MASFRLGRILRAGLRRPMSTAAAGEKTNPLGVKKDHIVSVAATFVAYGGLGIATAYVINKGVVGFVSWAQTPFGYMDWRKYPGATLREMSYGISCYNILPRQKIPELEAARAAAREAKAQADLDAAIAKAH